MFKAIGRLTAAVESLSGEVSRLRAQASALTGEVGELRREAATLTSETRALAGALTRAPSGAPTAALPTYTPGRMWRITRAVLVTAAAFAILTVLVVVFGLREERANHPAILTVVGGVMLFVGTVLTELSKTPQLLTRPRLQQPTELLAYAVLLISAGLVIGVAAEQLL